MAEYYNKWDKITLVNYAVNSSDAWQSGSAGAVANYISSINTDWQLGARYYIRLKAKFTTTNQNATAFSLAIQNANKGVMNKSGIVADTEYILSGIVEPAEAHLASRQIHVNVSPSNAINGVTTHFKELVVINLEETPQLLNALERKGIVDTNDICEWLDKYVAWFADDWRIGGDATNLNVNYFSEWLASPVSQYGLVIGTIGGVLNKDDFYYYRADAKYSTVNEHPTQLALYAQNGMGASVWESNPIEDTDYTLSMLTIPATHYEGWEQSSQIMIFPIGGLDGVTSYGKNCTCLNLTASGWLAMMYLNLDFTPETLGVVFSNFLKQHVAPFEGTRAFPKFEHEKAYLICENKCLVEGVPRSEMVNSIIEEGGTKKASYRKWRNGRVEQWGVYYCTIHGNAAFQRTSFIDLPIKINLSKYFNSYATIFDNYFNTMSNAFINIDYNITGFNPKIAFNIFQFRAIEPEDLEMCIMWYIDGMENTND